MVCEDVLIPIDTSVSRGVFVSRDVCGLASIYQRCVQTKVMAGCLNWPIYDSAGGRCIGWAWQSLGIAANKSASLFSPTLAGGAVRLCRSTKQARPIGCIRLCRRTRPDGRGGAGRFAPLIHSPARGKPISFFIFERPCFLRNLEVTSCSLKRALKGQTAVAPRTGILVKTLRKASRDQHCRKNARQVAGARDRALAHCFGGRGSNLVSGESVSNSV